MSGLRFKVGELAVVAMTIWPHLMGQVVEIVMVGPFPKWHVFPDGTHALRDTDYVISLAGDEYTVRDFTLRKIDPPAEPASLTRTTDEEVPA